MIVVPVNVPAFAVTVMLLDPSNDTLLIVTDAANLVAVLAFPLNDAVIVPAAKFPKPSRTTILFAVFTLAESTDAVIAAEPL